VFQLLHYLIQAIQPVLVPICFLFAWVFFPMLGWSLWSAMRDIWARSQEMHKIPCSQCKFFTNDYRLKCTVQPFIANTEGAIDCRDYHSKKNTY
jgi:hypothetical protein